MKVHRTGYYLVDVDGWIRGWGKEIDFVRSLQRCHWKTAVIIAAKDAVISKRCGSYIGVDQIIHADIIPGAGVR